MRVKISYGIELEDLPEEIIKLYDDVSKGINILEKQSDTVEDLLEAEEYTPCLSMITKFRETMGKIDSRLGDISLIMQGYTEYKKQEGEQNDPSERGSAVDTTGSNVVQGLEQSDGGDDESRTESSDFS